MVSCCSFCAVEQKNEKTKENGKALAFVAAIRERKDDASEPNKRMLLGGFFLHADPGFLFARRLTPWFRCRPTRPN